MECQYFSHNGFLSVFLQIDFSLQKMFSSRTLRIINNAETGVCEERMDNNNVDYPGLPKSELFYITTCQ